MCSVQPQPEQPVTTVSQLPCATAAGADEAVREDHDAVGVAAVAPQDPVAAARGHVWTAQHETDQVPAAGRDKAVPAAAVPDQRVRDVPGREEPGHAVEDAAV